jgi:hypothetical protein
LDLCLAKVLVRANLRSATFLDWHRETLELKRTGVPPERLPEKGYPPSRAHEGRPSTSPGEEAVGAQCEESCRQICLVDNAFAGPRETCDERAQFGDGDPDLDRTRLLGTSNERRLGFRPGKKWATTRTTRS